ncbi:hypothetical protein TrCOL_g12021 [Triparma columacea]|uniref:Major facilitator superfamily (MFS) profile domain-containing protein n=1 Tax=Triparma columacea TaxID=722753 RepID=A0A9W7GIS2_9STRA|nr:hypothetical protein TrCOL_g12021 [Triparma columacea]
MSPPNTSPTLPPVPNKHSLLVVWFALFCDYTLMTIPIAIFPQLGKSSIMTGALFSTKAILQIISSPFVARYIDNYNLEPMILGLMIESISTIIFSLTSNYYFWCIARAISGIASSLIISSGFLHIQRVYTTPTEMGHAMSTVATGIILGVTAGPPLGGVMYGSWEPLPFVFMVGLLAVATGAANRLQYRKYGKGWGQGFEGGGGGNNDKEEFREKALALLSDANITVTLFSLFCANASISCLESTFGRYMNTQFGFTVEQTGLLYILGALPSVIGSKLAGGLGNTYGRWRVVLLGMITQGIFFALGPKSSFTVEVISLLGLGFGMGLVDGCAPALLAQVTDLRHGGTGIVYTVNTMSIQLGFVVGPVAGSGIMQVKGFGFMSGVMGGFMVAASPMLLVNRNLPEVGEGEEEEEEAEVLVEMKGKVEGGREGGMV